MVDLGIGSSMRYVIGETLLKLLFDVHGKRLVVAAGKAIGGCRFGRNHRTHYLWSQSSNSLPVIRSVIF